MTENEEFLIGYSITVIVGITYVICWRIFSKRKFSISDLVTNFLFVFTPGINMLAVVIISVVLLMGLIANIFDSDVMKKKRF